MASDLFLTMAMYEGLYGDKLYVFYGKNNQNIMIKKGQGVNSDWISAYGYMQRKQALDKIASIPDALYVFDKDYFLCEIKVATAEYTNAKYKIQQDYETL